MITVLSNKNASTNIDLWFSSNNENNAIKKEESQSTTLQASSDGAYHRPKGSIPTMNRYGMFADDYKLLSADASKNISDIPLALSYETIDDYKNIPQSVFIDWKLIISMNDSPGHFHGFINADKRSQILNHIHLWKIANNY